MLASYAHGPSDDPAPRRDDRREPAPDGRALRRARGARRSPPALPGHLPRAVAAGRPCRARLPGRRRAQGRPRRHLGAEPPRVGRDPVRDRSRRRDPRDDQPGLQGRGARARAHDSRVSACSSWRAASAGPTTCRCSTRSAGGAPSCAGRSSSRTTGRPSWPGARDVGDEQLAQREAQLQFDDPINVQFTSGTTGLPKGATLSHHNIVNNAFFVAEALRFDERDRACVPVPFYHCFGMVLGTLACATHGACLVVPGESFDAAAVLGRSPPSAAPRSTACRPCSSPSSPTPASRATTCPACARG